MEQNNNRVTHSYGQTIVKTLAVKTIPSNVLHAPRLTTTTNPAEPTNFILFQL